MGELSTKKKIQTRQLKMLKSGFLTYEVGQAFAQNEFKSLVDIPITGIDISRIQVFVFGHGPFATTVIPGMGALITTPVGSSLVPFYKMTSSLLQIGITNSGVAYTPSPPYKDVFYGYYVMYS